MNEEFIDPRLATLSQRLKARVRPEEMTADERRTHTEFVRQRLADDDNGLDAFMRELQIWQQKDSLEAGDLGVVDALIGHAEKLRTQFVTNVSIEYVSSTRRC